MLSGRDLRAGVALLWVGCTGSSAPPPPGLPPAPGFVYVPSGAFVLGSAGYYPEEGPPERALVSGFFLQAHEVTNAEFLAFVQETGYLTYAERSGGSALFVGTPTPDAPMSWWRLDPGATWRTPEGAGSTLEGRAEHPVVHVTRDDARAYAAWAGGRLPYEVEWEYAATLGLFEADRPDSGAFGPDGRPRANVWTGDFPSRNDAADGFRTTAPVGSFPPDRIGAYDLIGNVWEWTDSPFVTDPAKATIKGGSYLCAPDHCRRYRPSARQAMEPDFSSAHLGFRVVAPLSIYRVKNER